MSKPDIIEVNSNQIHGRLMHIEDRLAGVEAILAHANKDQIEALVNVAVGTSDQKKEILRQCENPKTIKELQAALGLKSTQALNHHLVILKDHGLLRHAKTTSPVTYEWSPIITRLSNVAREKLLK